MKKSDLKTGMLLEFNSGKLGLIMLNTPQGDSLVSDGKGIGEKRTWMPLGELSEDLKLPIYSAEKSFVTKIWSYSTNSNAAEFSTHDRTILYDISVKKLKLTEEYDAEINSKEKVIKVGCQTISFAKVKELNDLISSL